MRAVDLIRHKRDGGTLDRRQIEAFVAGVTDGSFPDYQVAALLMAICLRGMTAEETAALTDAMVRSGVRVQHDLPGIPVDKHSTGGVGDKTSLILAPLAAACGARVPMMSGRALGHTGGTLDKLESIPGFRTALTLEELRDAVRAIGCALIGQTDQIAPADRRLYALRDVTATVESVPLIAASIMSKKIAEGIGALVLDVKTGAGAFMKTEAEARTLARALVSLGHAAGVRTEAMITDMNAPLGRAVGSSIEVVEAIETLKGRGAADLEQLSVTLAAKMLVLAGIADSDEAAERTVRQALASGAGLDRFRRIVERQGGNPAVVDDYALLPSAPDRETFRADRAGFVASVDAWCAGTAASVLGAGRARLADAIDFGVGLEIVARPGVQVAAGEPIVILHHRTGRGLAQALELLKQGITIDDEPPARRPVVLERITHG